MGETNEECEERVEERSHTQEHDTWMRWRAQTIEPLSCDRSLHMRANTRKRWRVRCTVCTLRRSQQIAISCKRTCYYNLKNGWAPPVFIPLPPCSTGRRSRRMPPWVLIERNWFRSLLSRFTVETVHICDCCSEVWSESHRCILARFVQWDIQVFPISLIFLRRWAVGVVFLCQLIHCDALLLGPANFELRITIYWISLETIVNSIKILFDTARKSSSVFFNSFWILFT